MFFISKMVYWKPVYRWYEIKIEKTILTDLYVEKDSIQLDKV